MRYHGSFLFAGQKPSQYVRRSWEGDLLKLIYVTGSTDLSSILVHSLSNKSQHTNNNRHSLCPHYYFYYYYILFCFCFIRNWWRNFGPVESLFVQVSLAHYLQKKHQIDSDSATCITYSTDLLTQNKRH